MSQQLRVRSPAAAHASSSASSSAYVPFSKPLHLVREESMKELRKQQKQKKRSREESKEAEEEEEEEEEQKGQLPIFRPPQSDEEKGFHAYLRKQPRKRTCMPDQGIDPRLLAVIRAVPIHYCNIMPRGHPCHKINGPVGGRVVFDWVIQFDADLFVPNPESFFHLKGKQFNISKSYLQFLSLLSVVIKSAESDEFIMVHETVTNEDGSKSKIKRREELEKNPIHVGWELVPHQDDPEKIVAYRLRVAEIGNNKLKHGLLTKLSLQLSENDKLWMRADKYEKSALQRISAYPLYHFGRMQTSEWREFCHMVWPKSRDFNSRNYNITDSSSPFNPCLVFTTQRACEQAANLEAHPHFCDPVNYYPRDKFSPTVHFPCPDYVYHFSSTDLDPQKIYELRLPHVRPDRTSFKYECEQFAKLHGIQDPEEARHLFDATYNRSTTQRPPNDMNALTKRILKEDAELRAKYMKKDARTLDDVDPEYYRARLKLCAGEWMDTFNSIFSATGDASDSVRACARYFDQYILDHGHLGIFNQPCFWNLDRFACLRAQESIALGKVMRVNTLHQDVLMMIYSAYHVYSRVELNIHHLYSGPPGIGKSFALYILHKLSIKGTTKLLGRHTKCAFSVPGKANACMIMIYEDAQPSSFGGKGGGLNKEAAASSDEASNMKTFLASKEMSIETIEMDPRRHGVTITTETSCVVLAAFNVPSSHFPSPILDRFVVTEASGVESNSADTSIRLLLEDARNQSPDVRQAEEDMASFFSRMQCIVAKLLSMEACGMLQPIDTAVADVVFAITAAVAAEQNFHIYKRARAVLRYRLLVRFLAALQAIDLTWDAPFTPLSQVPHRPEHFLCTNKYLFSTVQHGVFALGMLSRQWQDNTRDAILDTAIKRWFQKYAADIEAYQAKLKQVVEVDGAIDTVVEADDDDDPMQPGNQAYAPFAVQRPDPPANLPSGLVLNAQRKLAFPGGKIHTPRKGDAEAVHAYEQQLHEWNVADGLRKYWMYSTCQIGVGSPIPELPNNSKGTTEEIISHIAAQIYRVMPKQFLVEEIKGKLMAMTENTIDIVRQQYTGQILADGTRETTEVKFARNQLLVEPTCIRLAIPMIEQWDKHKDDILYGCTRDACAIITHVTGKPIQDGPLLYGECEKDENFRMVWRVLDPNVPREELEARLSKKLHEYGRIHNPGFASDITGRVTQAMLGSIESDYYDPSHMLRLFPAEQPFSVIDVKLDSYGAKRRADQLGLTLEEQHAFPSNDPEVCEAQLWERLLALPNLHKLAKYPEDIHKQFGKELEKQVQAQYERHKKDFLMSSAMARMEERQKSYKPIYAELLAPSDPTKPKAQPVLRAVDLSPSQPPAARFHARLPAHLHPPDLSPSQLRQMQQQQEEVEGRHRRSHSSDDTDADEEEAVALMEGLTRPSNRFEESDGDDEDLGAVNLTRHIERRRGVNRFFEDEACDEDMTPIEGC